MTFPADFVWAVTSDDGKSLWGYYETQENAAMQMRPGRSMKKYVLVDLVQKREDEERGRFSVALLHAAQDAVNIPAAMKEYPGTWVDPEIDALGAVLNALSPLDKSARDRVINWVMHRLDEEKSQPVDACEHIPYAYAEKRDR